MILPKLQISTACGKKCRAALLGGGLALICGMGEATAQAAVSGTLPEGDAALLVYRNAVLPFLICGGLLLVIIFLLLRENHRRRQAYFQVWREDRRLQAFMDGTPAGMGTFLVRDGKIRIGYMNDGFYAMLGTQREPRQSITAEDGSMAYVHAEDPAGSGG